MIFFVIIMAIVQGLTEFLPVSSSGHLVLLNKIFKVQNDFLLLSVILHVATLFSVLIVLRKEVKEIIKHPFGNLSLKTIVATIPTVIIVLCFQSFFKNSFDGKFLPFCFMISAVLIAITEILNKNRAEKNISYTNSIVMGIAQGIAVLPGISRSGTTICSGLLCGCKRSEVARFSFLMSVPIILASLVMEIYEYASAGQALTLAWYELLTGFVVAFLTGILAVKFMLKIVEKRSLWIFAVYLALLSVACFFII